MNVYKQTREEKFRRWPNSSEKIRQVAKIYFNHDQKPPLKLIEIAVEKITAILKVFEDQKKYKFYASSRGCEEI